MVSVHVSPNNDLIEHDLETDDCVCIPRVQPVKRDDGSFSWVIIHHSLDGREIKEAGHRGKVKK